MPCDALMVLLSFSRHGRALSLPLVGQMIVITDGFLGPMRLRSSKLDDTFAECDRYRELETSVSLHISIRYTDNKRKKI
eukprot:scaffold13305_cov126-Skeletonema_dohrnii-CCMP3373.AAC.2